MQQKILEYLKDKHTYLSGEELSSHLKISRQALWKHIHNLKDDGYEIVAVPHLGYKLISTPDRLFASEVNHGLNTNLIGKKIYYFDTINSTMDMAMQLGLKGTAEGTIVLAESQTRGKGRLGRSWVSPKYKGIYVSIVLRPEVTPNQTPILTLLSAVSICEAIKEISGVEAKIKWPNDIWVGNKKLGGVLTELNAEMDVIRFVVIGIGLNVNNDKKSLIPGATSLREEKGECLNRIKLLQEILSHLEKNYLLFKGKDHKFVIDKWRSLNITLGRRVRISLHKEHIEGQAFGIDNDGALLLRKDSGLIQKITSGDVVHCR